MKANWSREHTEVFQLVTNDLSFFAFWSAVFLILRLAVTHGNVPASLLTATELAGNSGLVNFLKSRVILFKVLPDNTLRPNHQLRTEKQLTCVSQLRHPL